TAVDQLVDAPRDRSCFAAAPVHIRLSVRGLVGDEQLDGVAKDRVREFAGRRKRLELVAEVAAEEVVDDAEHLRPRAVVHRQRQDAVLGLRAPFAEHLHVRMAEAVDRLELVADEEPLAGVRDQVDQLALQPVRVLELVDHDRAEAELLALADRVVVAQQVACAQLQVLEVERGLAVLRLLVGGGEPGEQDLQQLAVSGGELVERGLLDALARLLVRGGALAATTEVAEIEQLLRSEVVVEHELLAETARSLSELVDALAETAPLAQLEDEVASRGAQRLVHPGQHAAQPVSPVDGEQPEARRIVAGAEVRQGRLERFASQHAPLALVEHPETRVDARGEGMRTQEPMAEAVDRRDPGAVERAREVGPPALDEPGADAAAPLARRP